MLSRQRIKQHLRRGFHIFASTSGWLRRCEHRMIHGITILTYHRVLPDRACKDYPFASLVIPASTFEHQINWLARHCDVLPVAEAMCGSASTGRSRPLVCITFDDGYRDNHDIAGQILNRARLRATFFVTVGLIGTTEYLWFDRAAFQWRNMRNSERRQILQQYAGGESQQVDINSFPQWMAFLKKVAPETRAKILCCHQQYDAQMGTGYQLMTVEQLRNLHGAGHEIGSHTLTHPLLPQLKDQELQHELAVSRRRLSAIINSDVSGFCYPNGSYDDRTIVGVRDAGYAYACTTHSGATMPSRELMALPRVEVNPCRVTQQGQHDDLAFRSELCGLRGIRL